MYGRMFSSIFGLYPPDASSTYPPHPLAVKTKTVSRHRQMFPEAQNCPQFRTIALCFAGGQHPYFASQHYRFVSSNTSFGRELWVHYSSLSLTNQETPVCWFRKPSFQVSLDDMRPSYLPQSAQSQESSHTEYRTAV